MEFRKLEYFLKVCETGTVSDAAKKLYISQQAISKSIESLETEIGLPLFYRTSSGMKLTRYGQVLLQEGLDLSRHHNDILRKLCEMKSDHEQSVSIAFFSGMMLQFPPNFFRSFIERHMDTQFSFQSYVDTDYGRKYMNKDVDLFFSTTIISRNDIMLHNCHRPMYVLVDRNHPLTRKKMIFYSDLKDYNVININSDMAASNRIQESLDKHNIITRHVLSDAEQDFGYSLVRTSEAVMFFAGPTVMVPNDIERCPFENFTELWDSYIYGRKGLLPHAAKDLVSEIIAFRSLD